ncbi:MAG: ATP synthase F0 subunit C [Firmicutes bacterium]|nr:ATP synthase F0 subunit C [Bacillota bacterium]HHY34006.1 ATP synthase F0 subunit C [Bacillota bacterium]
MTEVMLLKIISVAAICIIVCVAALVAGLGDAHVAGKAVDGIARQPEAKASIFSTMLIGVGLVEATPIIALVVALILLYANPFLG